MVFLYAYILSYMHKFHLYSVTNWKCLYLPTWSVASLWSLKHLEPWTQIAWLRIMRSRIFIKLFGLGSLDDNCRIHQLKLLIPTNTDCKCQSSTLSFKINTRDVAENEFVWRLCCCVLYNFVCNTYPTSVSSIHQKRVCACHINNVLTLNLR